MIVLHRLRQPVLALVLAMTSCATWQSATRRALDAVSRTATLAPQVAELVCDRVMERCRATSDMTCAPLVACERAERDVATAVVGVQTAALTGLAAVEASQQATAAAALARALELLEPVRRILSGYGEVLP
jgi:hypothetical protein